MAADEQVDEQLLNLPGNIYRASKIDGGYKWTIFDIFELRKSTNNVHLVSQKFFVGRFEWIISISVGSNPNEGGTGIVLSRIQESTNKDSESPINVTFHFAAFFEHELLAKSNNTTLLFNSSTKSTTWYLPGIDLTYRNKLTAKLTPRNVPLVITCKINFIELEVLEGNSLSTEHIYDLRSPKFQLKQFDDFKKLFESDLGSKFSDLVIVCKDWEFKVHKAILAARSDYFLGIFSNNCKESNENKIFIEDIKKKVFCELLRFIYCGNVQNFKEIAEELLIAADRYQIDGLKKACEKYFCDELNENNLARCVLLADTYNVDKLKKKTDELIACKVLKMLRDVHSVKHLEPQQKYHLSQVMQVKKSDKS